MVTIRVQGRTPEGSESLCRACSRGHIITGFRASEQAVYCRTFYIEREIRFPVRECTFYEDRRLASKEDVEKLGRNDLCPCGSARRFQAVLHGYRAVRREQPKLLFPQVVRSSNTSPPRRAKFVAPLWRRAQPAEPCRISPHDYC
jgi:hypothetical protein